MTTKLTQSRQFGIEKGFNVQALFKLMVESKASDLHLTANSPPQLRIHGSLTPVKMNYMNGEDTKRLIYQVLSKRQISLFEKNMELDFSFEIKNLARFRGNVFYSKGATAAVFRLIPASIPSFEILGLPRILLKMTNVKNGLILVTGETGSGKSTTLASMLDNLNQQGRGHIVTLEDPIEFVHNHKKSLINQREIGRDSLSFPNAIKGLLRQDPDVVLIGELRDPPTIEAALTIAETGHLTFGTLHTNSCVQTLSRLINVFPPSQQEQIRTLLSFVLQGVVSQQLIAKTSGKGRAAALEVLLPTSGIRNLIREDKNHQIYSQMQIGQDKSGMMTMNQSLKNLMKKGDIDFDTALRHSIDPDELKKMK